MHNEILFVVNNVTGHTRIKNNDNNVWYDRLRRVRAQQPGLHTSARRLIINVSLYNNRCGTACAGPLV